MVQLINYRALLFIFLFFFISRDGSRNFLRVGAHILKIIDKVRQEGRGSPKGTPARSAEALTALKLFKTLHHVGNLHGKKIIRLTHP